MTTASTPSATALDSPGGVRHVTAASGTAARIAFVSATAFLVLLALLHVLKPEFDPSWRFVSEYAIGRHAWVMVVAFLSLALSCVSVFVAVRSQVSTTAGRVGLGVLLLVAASLISAGTFVSDPITATKDQLTTHGHLHGLSAMVGIPGFPLAAILISRSLAKNPTWTLARRSLLRAAHLTWISLVLMFAVLGVTLSQNDGVFGPDVVVGWPNRLVIVAYALWLLVVARQAAR